MRRDKLIILVLLKTKYLSHELILRCHNNILVRYCIQQIMGNSN